MLIPTCSILPSRRCQLCSSNGFVMPVVVVFRVGGPGIQCQAKSVAFDERIQWRHENLHLDSSIMGTALEAKVLWIPNILQAQPCLLTQPGSWLVNLYQSIEEGSECCIASAEATPLSVSNSLYFTCSDGTRLGPQDLVSIIMMLQMSAIVPRAMLPTNNRWLHIWCQCIESSSDLASRKCRLPADCAQLAGILLSFHVTL